MSKKQKIQKLKAKIKLAESSVEKAMEILFKDSSTENIINYNNRLAKLGQLNIKLRHLTKTTSSEQYMEEYRVPGDIFL